MRLDLHQLRRLTSLRADRTGCILVVGGGGILFLGSGALESWSEEEKDRDRSSSFDTSPKQKWRTRPLRSQPVPSQYCSATSFWPRATLIASAVVTHCESNPAYDTQTRPTAPIPPPPPPPSVSWFRKALCALHLSSLPLPRRLLHRNDPDLTLPRHVKRQRQRDQQLVQALESQLHQLRQDSTLEPEIRHQQVSKIVKQVCDILYGPNITPQDQVAFLERFGCTGWTDEAVNAIVELAWDRGIVEIGAGHGQWARHLTDCYQSKLQNDQEQPRRRNKLFEFVLAYDNHSKLPLDPEVYHQRTQPHHQYFYRNVQHCESISGVLRLWQCRGRVLLLVYPRPDNDMAIEGLQAYMDVPPTPPSSSSLYQQQDQHYFNDTVVYVGEGRGGVNANDEFFDLLETSGEWILDQIIPVKPFGTKGYEQMYIFRRCPPITLSQKSTASST